MRRQCTIKHLQTKFGGTMSKHGTFCNIGTPVWPIRFCSKICNVGGRIISAPTTHRNFRSVIRWHRLRRGGYQPPGCFPTGKQRRRNAPTMHHQTFANEIRRHYVGKWYILQHRSPAGPIRFCSKDLPRWRAANSRPYIGACNVGGRVPPNHLGGNFGAPTMQHPPQSTPSFHCFYQ